VRAEGPPTTLATPRSLCACWTRGARDASLFNANERNNGDFPLACDLQSKTLIVPPPA